MDKLNIAQNVSSNNMTAGEMLKQLERGQGQNNQWTASPNGGQSTSQYRQVLEETNTSRGTANRWQALEAARGRARQLSFEELR